MKYGWLVKYLHVAFSTVLLSLAANSAVAQTPSTQLADSPSSSSPIVNQPSKPRFPLVKPLQVTKRQTYTYRGDAYDLENGTTLLYRELHTVYLEDDQPSERRVRYERANGELLASKTTRYNDNPLAPDFTLSDARDGYQEEAYQDGNRRRLTLKESALSKPQTDRLKAPRLTAVVDAGFDEFVRSRWNSLLANKSTSFSFAVPSRQEYIDFRLVPIRISKDEVELEMRLKSRLLSWLMDPIKLTYDRNSRRLLRYRGLTNIRDDNGQGIYADIRYRYPEILR